ncbi:signal peptidase I [Christensenellaceae bacterium OttesenSCG-928-K19]|nr:signal peptidase I [Christensenellaceae bacterium OttesenSCG-928-K19]
MDKDNRASYARRSKKYKDNSNFGVTEKGAYTVSELSSGEQSARAYDHHTLPDDAFIYEDTDGMAPPDHSRYTQQSFLTRKPIRQQQQQSSSTFRRPVSNVPDNEAHYRSVAPQQDISRRQIHTDDAPQATVRRQPRRAYRDLDFDEPPRRPAKTDSTVEEYDPGDLLEYDEFGRRRKKQPSLAEKSKTKNRRKEALGWVFSIIVAIVVAFVIRAFVFEIILVDGDSMFPTLHTNERVAIEKVTRYGGMPNRGEIIIVEYPNMTGTYVKRAIGLPGETVEIRDSVVYIDGIALSEDYINPEPYQDMEPVTVPENHVFVMGDNRAHSLDSRTLGPISHDAILGHGLFVIWPFDNAHALEKVEY